VLHEGLRLAVRHDRAPQAKHVPLGDDPRTAVRAHELGAEPDAHAQLLVQLAVQRLDGRLPRVYLAARELPPSGDLHRPAAARRQQARRVLEVVDEGGGDDEAAGSHARDSVIRTRKGPAAAPP